MHNIFKTSIIITAALLTGLLSNAQQNMSLQQCRQKAIETSLQLKIADKTIEQAQAQKWAARTYFLPSVKASATMAYMNKNFTEDIYLPTYTPNLTTGTLEPNLYIHPQLGQPVNGADGNPVFNMYAYFPLELSLKGAYMAGINIEQPVFAGGKIIAANKMANIGVEMAGTNLELQKNNTLVEADQAYWLYVSVGEKVKLAKTAVQMLDSIVKRVETAYNTGLVHQNELFKAQVQYNNAQLDLQKAQSGLELTRMSLCRVTGLPFETKIVAVDTVISCTDTVLLKHATASVEQRPEYILLNKQVELQNEQINIARAEYLPTIGVSAGYSYLGGIELSGTEITNGNINVIGSVKIPIFKWGQGKKKIESARVDRDIKQLELNKNTQLMRLEIEQAHMELNNAYLRTQMVEQALEQAAENLRLSRNNYELGAELMTSLLIAQTQWHKAYSDVIDAKTDFKLKETLYLKAISKLNY